MFLLDNTLIKGGGGSFLHFSDISGGGGGVKGREALTGDGGLEGMVCFLYLSYLYAQVTTSKFIFLQTVQKLIGESRIC